MLYKLIFALFLYLGLPDTMFGQTSSPFLLSLDNTALQINRTKIQQKDPAIMPAYQQLLKEADAMVKDNRIYTVMEKKQLPPSGDKHDYMSIAIYFWPDPDKPNGLPYIRKDGQINPEVEDYKDKANINSMIKAVHTLSLAYYFSNDERYAKMAVRQIKAWFLDSSTRMNPHFNFAQAIKGVNDGRGIGIIECRDFVRVLDGVGLMKNYSGWTPKEQQGMESWFNQFLTWLVTSKNGIEELNTHNNHGVWYDAQKLAYALFTHHDEMAMSAIKHSQSRLSEQMDSTGFFPAEMDRTISLHYSAFIMEPYFLIAEMSERLNTDMWHYTTTTGCSVEKGFNALRPYLSKQKNWIGNQIKPFDYLANAVPLLAKGYQVYSCKDCIDDIKNIAGQTYEKNIQHLLTTIDN